MSNYSSFTQAIVCETKAREEALPLLYEDCRSRFFLHPTPTSKVCLFFHGFTATPEQFVPLGEVFFKSGYNVLIPLQPGHGIAGNWNGNNPPPLPDNRQIYQDFALYWLEIARKMGEKVIVSGLSSGGTLAAWLALECPESIERAMLFAPYLSGSNKFVDWLVRSFKFYFKWRTQLGKKHLGYEGFFMPDLRLFLEMADEVMERVKTRLDVPILMVASDSDRAVSKKQLESFFQAAVKRQPKSWYYCFDRSLNVPHTMLTKAEGNDNIDMLIALAKAYVESDITWAEFSVGKGERGGRGDMGRSFEF